MSNYTGEARKRSQNLLIVEGNHEKNELFWLIFKCFPEINISMDDIWIYGTNIYMLYDDIVKEYGSDWATDNDDIDLPFVISKKQCPKALRYKEDFTNIIIVFDYERHDTNFSEKKILEMQSYFIDAADMGKLYINYPMIESYQHLQMLPDSSYAQRRIPVSLQPGIKYKSLVRIESKVAKYFDFPHRVDDLLNVHFGIIEEKTRKKCCDAILNISSKEDIEDIIQETLQGVIDSGKLMTAKYQLKDWVLKQGYADKGQDYWTYMKHIFKQIICHNICKANQIQYNNYNIENDALKNCFERLDLTEILRIQNSVSQDVSTGFIWVLNTCVFVVAEYNFVLVA